MRRYAGRRNGECLSSIKHVVSVRSVISGKEIARRIAVKITPSCCLSGGDNQSVRRHLDAFTRGRIIGKLEEGRSVTSVAAEFGIAQHRFTTLETISNYRNNYPGVQ
ncbi:hypothetical protein TNCV_2707221 [Trichonephila clavipes]|nr:hypothetical protein TNCV_2707221 [Trichonephila clavipes]